MPSKKHPVVKLSQSYYLVGDINYSHYFWEHREGNSGEYPHILFYKSTISTHYYSLWALVVNIGWRGYKSQLNFNYTHFKPSKMHPVIKLMQSVKEVGLTKSEHSLLEQFNPDW